MDYIYALVDPREPLVIRYIGYTSNLEARFNSHCSEARRSNYKTRKSSWIRSLQKEGINPVLEVLEIDPPEGWKLAERAWIRLLRLLGFPLTNHAPGGEGNGNPATLKNCSNPDCRNNFLIGGDGVSRHKKYCSQHCAKKCSNPMHDPKSRAKVATATTGVKKTRTALFHESYKKRQKPREQRICPNCSRTFIVGGRDGSQSKICCSTYCAHEYRRTHPAICTKPNRTPTGGCTVGCTCGRHRHRHRNR